LIALDEGGKLREGRDERSRHVGSGGDGVRAFTFVYDDAATT
jgi:hypothetical protein